MTRLLRGLDSSSSQCFSIEYILCCLGTVQCSVSYIVIVSFAFPYVRRASRLPSIESSNNKFTDRLVIEF
jgi:hypothetical protein